MKYIITNFWFLVACLVNTIYLNVKSIYKSCRKLGKQGLSTESNIRYINTKYSSLFPTVAVAQWLAYLLFESYIPGSSRVGRYFIFHKISRLKGPWNVPAIQSTEWSLNGDWNTTENHLFRHHSVAIQRPFIHRSVDWKLGFHPVFF